MTLNRPERMNALDKHSHEELIEIFDDFAADEDSWVAIITGAGDRAFCGRQRSEGDRGGIRQR